MDKGEFQELLGKRGLNLKLPLDEVEMVIDEIADQNGAIEAKDFTRFLAVRDLPAYQPSVHEATSQPVL